jgi:hypothetical protein|uniref:Uncharacterized protein n=1 Tax=Myoviridae sp. ctqYq4 TaxID=2826702 RepID=A0A8S5LW22_9CAUD|nr:MAG TPA: hypothetical protein [Myoviridae sp. ctqYq4]
MKTTMRDKVCQLIGKYQFLEEDFRSKSFFRSGPFCGPYGQQEEAIKAKMCSQFLTDLKNLLEEDEAAAAQDDPRKTAPAGKWCANSAAQATESAAKEARNDG